jgi:hypothetical protein
MGCISVGHALQIIKRDFMDFCVLIRRVNTFKIRQAIRLDFKQALLRPFSTIFLVDYEMTVYEETSEI